MYAPVYDDVAGWGSVGRWCFVVWFMNDDVAKVEECEKKRYGQFFVGH